MEMEYVYNIEMQQFHSNERDNINPRGPVRLQPGLRFLELLAARTQNSSRRHLLRLKRKRLDPNSIAFQRNDGRLRAEGPLFMF